VYEQSMEPVGDLPDAGHCTRHPRSIPTVMYDTIVRAKASVTACFGIIAQLELPDPTSALSDRRSQKDRQLEVTDAGTGAPEDVRYVGSNPVVPTSFRNEPFGQQVEGHYA
jgi:hypothetical protein